MNIEVITSFAKKTQTKLKQMGIPAEHIYALDYISMDRSPALIFVSDAYNNMDLYNRSLLATKIQSGPLKISFYITGTTHLFTGTSQISREKLYHATKIYGKTPLILDDMEFATPRDFAFKQDEQNNEKLTV